MPAPADLGPASTDPATAEPAGTGPQRRRRWRRGLTETAITLLVAAVLSVLLRAYAGEIFWVPSASMVPTLAVYDRILVQKAFFNWHDVREGDIVVFTHPPLDQCGGVQAGDLVKRVIARCRSRRSTPLATPSTSTGTCWPSRTCRPTTRSARRSQAASILTASRPASSTSWATTAQTPATAATGGPSGVPASSARPSWSSGTTTIPTSTAFKPKAPSGVRRAPRSWLRLRPAGSPPTAKAQGGSHS